jgi:hypothetical protein
VWTSVDNVGGPLFNQLVAMLGFGGCIGGGGKERWRGAEFNTASL